MSKVNSEWLKQYLEHFNSCAGNDGLSYDDVLESDYSPYSSIVNSEGIPVLEIGFSMRTGEPFLAWANCGIKQLFVDLPLEIPKIVEMAIHTEELARELADDLERARGNLLLLLAGAEADPKRYEIFLRKCTRTLSKVKEALGDGH